MIFSAMFVLLPLAALAACREGEPGSCSTSGSQMLLQSSKHRMSQSSIMTYQSKDSDDLLKQWQARAESAVHEGKKMKPLELTAIAAVNDTLENTTIPALKKGHVDEQLELNAALRLLTNCNSNFDVDAAAANLSKEAVDAKIQEHRYCRGNQTELKGNYGDISTELESFIDGLNKVSSGEACGFPSVAAGLDGFLSKGVQWLEKKQKTYGKLKTKYTTAKGNLKNKSEACDSQQGVVDNDACEWFGRATAALKSFTRCWNQAKSSFGIEGAAALDSAEQRKHEYVAVRKIQCFLSVLFTNKTSAGAKKLKECTKLVPNTSMFDLANTSLPQKSDVTRLGKLSIVPGTQSWKDSVYGGLGDLKKATPCVGAKVVHLCNPDQRVQTHRCESCDPGKTNQGGDDAVGPDTNCSAIKCQADEYVISNKCMPCSPGTQRAAGDDASSADTLCIAIRCLANERVVNKSCYPCSAGTTNAAHDDASSNDTSCDPILCLANQRVLGNACHACPAGTNNTPGDDASRRNTSCDAIKCEMNQYVKSNACHTCPPGTTNQKGDDASGRDTKCDATKCKVNKKVVNNNCSACPAGKTNAASDDASGKNTKCDEILCPVNMQVRGNACVSCPDGTTNAAGDLASGADTSCDPIHCQINHHVVNHACVICPAGSRNPRRDDASKSDTSCQAWGGSCSNGRLRHQSQRTADNQCGGCNSGHYLSSGTSCNAYGGSCRNGWLRSQSSRTAHNQCGSCYSGYYRSGTSCHAYGGSCRNGWLRSQSSRTAHNQCGSCNSYYRLSGTSCYATCDAGNYCSSGWTKITHRRRGRGHWTSPSNSRCCEPTCDAGNYCSSSWTKITHRRRGRGHWTSPSNSRCCEPTCGAGNYCSSGWTKITGRGHWTSPSNSRCCKPTCDAGNYCSSGWTKITHRRRGRGHWTSPSNSRCCEPTCNAGNYCSSSYVKVAGRGHWTSPSNGRCCTYDRRRRQYFAHTYTRGQSYCCAGQVTISGWWSRRRRRHHGVHKRNHGTEDQCYCATCWDYNHATHCTCKFWADPGKCSLSHRRRGSYSVFRRRIR